MEIEEWVRNAIHGPGGMISYEEHELVIWGCDDRTAVAYWILRCLANPRSEGSADVLSAIAGRRGELTAEPTIPATSDIIWIPRNVAEDALSCLDACSVDDREPGRYRSAYTQAAEVVRSALATVVQ